MKNITIGVFTYAGTNEHAFLLPRELRYAAYRQNCHLVVHAVSQMDEITTEWLQKYSPLRPGSVDGLIFAYSNPDLISYAERLAADGFPVILIAREGTGVPSIMPDNHRGIHTAVEHLVHHGHSRIAFLSGPEHNPAAQERLQGYHDALIQAGMDFDPRMIISGQFLSQAAQDSMSEFLGRKIPFTALIAANDASAFGAIQAIKNAGLRIPEDVAVIGFDNIPMARYSDPPLSTVFMPNKLMADSAMNILVSQVKKGCRQTGVQRIPTTLIQRRSCGCHLGTILFDTCENIGSSSSIEDLLAQQLFTNSTREFFVHVGHMTEERSRVLAKRLVESAQDSNLFLRTFAQVIDEAVDDGFDPDCGNELISLLRAHFAQTCTETWKKLEDTFDRGRILVHEISSRFRTHHYVQFRSFYHLTGVFRQTMATAMDETTACTALTTLLRNTGFQAFGLLIHDKSEPEAGARFQSWKISGGRSPACLRAWKNFMPVSFLRPDRPVL